MSTRSRIGIVRENGTVLSVYCHSDGYVDGGHGHGVGTNILRRFSDASPEEIEEFVAEGDRTTFEQSYKEWRNEDCPPAEDETLEEFRDHVFDNGEVYAYVFEDGHWFVKCKFSEIGWIGLEVAIEMEKNNNFP